MKLLHCADLHLDSPMESNFSSDKARERKGELRAAFGDLVRCAEEEGCEGILIAGDLFDSRHVTGSTEKYVRDCILSHPALRFFYLAGNHDRGSVLRSWDPMPENLFLFDGDWKTYRIGSVTVTGSESPDPTTLRLAEEDVNILLLHGQERAGNGAPREDVIHLGKYKNKNIDYAALGHIHEYRAIRVDKRMLAVYAGCPEGRGFDECDVKGYVLLEIEGRRLTHRFVPFAKRTLHTVACDVTEATSLFEMEERMMAAVQGIPRGDLVKVVLTGEIPPDAQPDTAHLCARLAGRFYFSKVKNECRLLIRPEDYRNDVSLKGEFVRRVLSSDLDEQEKERVIACGFHALAGEEIGL